MALHLDVAGFARAAAAYERGRPGYPREVVEHVAKAAGLGPFSIVVDLAAGTGKLTRELTWTGARVIAVEPLAEMRAVLRSACVFAGAGVDVVDGTAAATGLGRRFVDCVTVAQALHWFTSTEALRSMAGLLRPRGHLAVLWNRRRTDQPVQGELRRLLGPHQAAMWAAGSGWRDLLAESDLFEQVDEFHVPHVFEVDRQRLADHVCSYAFVPNLPEGERSALVAEAVALAPEGGSVGLQFTADAYVYRRTEVPGR